MPKGVFAYAAFLIKGAMSGITLRRWLVRGSRFLPLILFGYVRVNPVAS